MSEADVKAAERFLDALYDLAAPEGLNNEDVPPIIARIALALASARAEGEAAGFEAGRALMHAHCLADEINQHRQEWEAAGAAKEREVSGVDTIRAERDEAESRLTLAFIECVKPVADAYVSHGERYWSLRDGIKRFLRERGRIE